MDDEAGNEAARRKAMQGRSIPVALMLASTACGPKPQTAPAPTQPPRPSTANRIPTQLGRYKLTRRDAVEGAPNDSAYRYTDGSATRVTVFVYAIPIDVQVGADSQSWTPREGEKFEEVQPLLVQRGMIGAYEVAFANTGEITAANRRITEHATAIAVRTHGQVAVDFQYVYLVAGRFLKIRATVPSDGWEKTDVPIFARDLARRLASADSTPP
jgi:hypothetical protein